VCWIVIRIIRFHLLSGPQQKENLCNSSRHSRAVISRIARPIFRDRRELHIIAPPHTCLNLEGPIWKLDKFYRSLSPLVKISVPGILSIHYCGINLARYRSHLRFRNVFYRRDYRMRGLISICLVVSSIQVSQEAKPDALLLFAERGSNTSVSLCLIPID